MDEKKFEIIIHATDERFLSRLIQSLEAVVVPENFSAEIQPVMGAEKYFAYDAAMRASDARYKIYLDERAVVTDENFLFELLRIFNSDGRIAAVCTSGALELSTHGISLLSAKRTPKNFRGEVEIVDGFFFATQYDLPWRHVMTCSRINSSAGRRNVSSSGGRAEKFSAAAIGFHSTKKISASTKPRGKNFWTSTRRICSRS